MDNSGNLFGWLIIAGLFLTLLNYPVKAIYRGKIACLPQTSATRRVYSRFQRVITANHRFFAIFTTLMLAAHIVIQLLYRWLSWTGLAAAILMVLNASLGSYGHYIRKKKRSLWFYLHRTVAVLLIAAVFVHLVTNGH